jgi:cytochrome c oxidase subunit 4
MSSKPIPKKIFVRVWVALLALLALTWGLAQLNLGRLNAVVALTIAIVKMLLVLLYFMHVRYSSRLTWIFVAAGFIWFLIMVDLTLGDYLTRGQVPGNPLGSWEHGTWPAFPEEQPHGIGQ